MLLKEENPDIKVVIKPIGSSGHGTFVPTSPEELRFYDFPYGDVVLQTVLAEDGADGPLISPSVQYFSARIIEGKICERVVLGSTTYGLRSCTADAAFIDQITQKSRQLLDVLKPQGAGAFDFIAQHGEPLLTDIHTQSGVEHFTKLFHALYGRNKAFASWCPPPWLPRLSLFPLVAALASWSLPVPNPSILLQSLYIRVSEASCRNSYLAPNTQECVPERNARHLDALDAAV